MEDLWTTKNVQAFIKQDLDGLKIQSLNQRSLLPNFQYQKLGKVSQQLLETYFLSTHLNLFHGYPNHLQNTDNYTIGAHKDYIGLDAQQWKKGTSWAIIMDKIYLNGYDFYNIDLEEPVENNMGSSSEVTTTIMPQEETKSLKNIGPATDLYSGGLSTFFKAKYFMISYKLFKKRLIT